MSIEKHKNIFDKIIKYTLYGYGSYNNNKYRQELDLFNFNTYMVNDNICFPNEAELFISDEDLEKIIENITEQDVYKIIKENKHFNQAIENFVGYFVKTIINGFLDKNERVQRKIKAEKERVNKNKLLEKQKEKTNKLNIKKLISAEVKKSAKRKK